jgi:hypothetical protein
MTGPPAAGRATFSSCGGTDKRFANYVSCSRHRFAAIDCVVIRGSYSVCFLRACLLLLLIVVIWGISAIQEVYGEQ